MPYLVHRYMTATPLLHLGTTGSTLPLDHCRYTARWKLTIVVTSLEDGCGICGYHVCKEAWSPSIGENFACFNEVENDHVTHCTHKQRTVNAQCQDHRGQVAIGVDAAQNASRTGQQDLHYKVVASHSYKLLYSEYRQSDKNRMEGWTGWSITTTHTSLCSTSDKDMHLIMKYTTYHLVEEYVNIALITSGNIELQTWYTSTGHTI